MACCCVFKSINTIYIQEEDLDSQQGVIDFSLYLRTKRDLGEEDVLSISSGGGREGGGSREGSTAEGGGADENMTTVLDQKNYIEELNRHLK